jgi:hypothetical protein
MTKYQGMSCDGPCRGTKSQKCTLHSLRICRTMLWQVSEQDTDDFSINI